MASKEVDDCLRDTSSDRADVIQPPVTPDASRMDDIELEARQCEQPEKVQDVARFGK